MAADRAGTSGSLLMVLVFWLRSVESFGLFLPVNWSRKRAGSGYARRFPQFKPKALIRNEVARPHNFIPLQTPEAFRNAGSRGCFWFARSLRWFGRQFIVIWFDHTQPSPLLPMASTGHPSMASLQSASSSGVVGCLNT